MNVIQIQDLINKIGEFNKNTDLNEYSERGEEILESQLKIIQDSNEELNHKLLIQLKEKSDVELLQKFIKLIDTNGADLHTLYHKYRRKLSESNDSNPIYTKSIPILCKLIDSKLDVLTDLKRDLIIKIANFDYRISTDFDYNSNTLSELNQNQKNGITGRATFNLSKKESIMLLYILEKTDLLKFESDGQISKFIENNFCFTEIRDNAGNNGQVSLMKDVRSEISNLRAGHKSDSNNKILEKLLNKLNDTIHLFEF